VNRRLLTITGLACLITSCQMPTPATEGDEDGARSDGDAEVLRISVLSEPEVVSGVGALNDQRQQLADILFEGLQALDADRLLTPIDDSAYARFQRALAYDPDNEIALQGLRDIVARYLELSLQASRRGLFAEAATLLENARFVDPEHPDIAAAWLTLQAEMNSGDLFFDLDPRELSQRSELAQQRLIEIAEQARAHSATFLITAPNDDLARWIFSVMRDAVDGYRLRGNIELASRTTVRLRMPRN
jgi:hypothetical protein